MFVIGDRSTQGIAHRGGARRSTSISSARSACVRVVRSEIELVAFAARFEPRCWAIEGATGTGALLAQQLVAAGETVLDVPPDTVGTGAAARQRTERQDRRARRSVRRGGRVAALEAADRWRSRTTRRCCACSRNVTTTWSRTAPGPSVACTQCCACWSPAACHASFQPLGRLPSCVASAPPTRSGSNVAASPVELLAEVRARGS